MDFCLQALTAASAVPAAEAAEAVRPLQALLRELTGGWEAGALPVGRPAPAATLRSVQPVALAELAARAGEAAGAGQRARAT